MEDTQGAWLFAYGSLLWEPGFEPAQSVRASLPGWRRSFCLWSIHWRGTAERPGLVLGLEEEAGAACEGLAMRLPDDGAAAIIAAIRARELVSDAYEERALAVVLADGRAARARAYVICRGHPQHAQLDPEAQALTIGRAHGERGPNRDYLTRTAARLRDLGIEDAGIEGLLHRVNRLAPGP